MLFSVSLSRDCESVSRNVLGVAKAAVLTAAVAILGANPAAAICVTVDPGAYAGDWGHVESGPVPSVFQSGIHTIEAFEGFNFMFVGGISGFQFNVASDGTVTTGSAAQGGDGTLTFNTVNVAIDPGDFTDDYVISRVGDAVNGPISLALVPTMNYLVFVGGGNFARFNFTVGLDGVTTATANTDAANGGAGVLTFNTTEVFVNPGAYLGSWQVPAIGYNQSIIQAIGPASVTLVTGVSYVIIPDRAGLNFPVTDPCTTTELDFVDYPPNGDKPPASSRFASA